MLAAATSDILPEHAEQAAQALRGNNNLRERPDAIPQRMKANNGLRWYVFGAPDRGGNPSSLCQDGTNTYMRLVRQQNVNS
ncbi:MAG: hypothetical protein CVV45_05385 [Spirochaetae bacterium HGW-Spirochaetae-10]|nr:MAG: hypothetical protein CVV45_05385 [Spirochaetae bacterium HGW-Spirochaetae-10]